MSARNACSIVVLSGLAGCYLSAGSPGGEGEGEGPEVDEAGQYPHEDPGPEASGDLPGYGVCSDDLPQVSERSFQVCRTSAECPYPDSDICYHAEGTSFGFCHFGDADIWCDGEGDVNVQTNPPLADWGPGMCAPHEWRDEMCCRFPGEWVCP